MRRNFELHISGVGCERATALQICIFILVLITKYQMTLGIPTKRDSHKTETYFYFHTVEKRYVSSKTLIKSTIKSIWLSSPEQITQYYLFSKFRRRVCQTKQHKVKLPINVAIPAVCQKQSVQIKNKNQTIESLMGLPPAQTGSEPPPTLSGLYVVFANAVIVNPH